MTIAHKGFVQGIAFDRNHGRIASVGGDTAQVWKLSAGRKLSVSSIQVFSLTSFQAILENIVTDVVSAAGVMVQSAHFCEAGASLIICLCESHEM